MIYYAYCKHGNDCPGCADCLVKDNPMDYELLEIHLSDAHWDVWRGTNLIRMAATAYLKEHTNPVLGADSTITKGEVQADSVERQGTANVTTGAVDDALEEFNNLIASEIDPKGYVLMNEYMTWENVKIIRSALLEKDAHSKETALSLTSGEDAKTSDGRDNQTPGEAIFFLGL